MASFLLSPYAPTSGLAHLGSCLAVARELRERGHRCIFAYSGTRAELINAEGFESRAVPGVPPEREWSPREWFRDADELEPAVEAHRRLIGELAPAATISSNDVVGRLAAELSGIPRLHLMHYLAKSRYGRRATVWRQRRRDLAHPRRAWRVARARARSTLRDSSGAPVALAVAELRRRAGLEPAPADALLGCPDSAVALTTTPFLDPARGLPPGWDYVGPILWSPPDGPREYPRVDGLPLVYVTQGATGSADHLRLAVEALEGEPVRVLASTGGLLDPGELEALASNVEARDLVSGEAAMRAADLAVIHGGHLTFSQALRSATPVLVLPRGSDQIGRVHVAAQLGVGAGLFPVPRRMRAVRRAIRRLLSDDRVHSRAAGLAEELDSRWDGARNAADLAERLAGIAGAARSAPER